MPPLDKDIMSESLRKIENIVTKFETLYESNKVHAEGMKERQEIWEKLIHEQTENTKEKLELIDKRWGNLMKVVLTLTGLFLMSFIGDRIALDKRPTSNELTEILDDRDCASKSEVIRGINSLTNSIYETIERETEMTHDEAREEKTDAKLNAGKEIIGYRTRSILKD